MLNKEQIVFPRPSSVIEYLTDVTSVNTCPNNVLTKLRCTIDYYNHNGDFSGALKGSFHVTDAVGEELGLGYSNYQYSVGSLFSNMQYMFAIGVIYRIVNLSTLSLTSAVNKRNSSIATKLLASTAISIGGYLLMGALGYPAAELLIADIVRVGAQYLLPYVLGNQLKEIDVISPTKEFNAKSYLLRNALNFSRNTISSLGLDLLLSSLFENEMGLDFTFGDDASIDCYSYQGVVRHCNLVGNKNVSYLKYLTDESGYILGKSFVDLSIVVLSRVFANIDIRDPFKCVFSNEKIKKPKVQKIQEEKASKRAAIEAQINNANNNVSPNTVGNAGRFKAESISFDQALYNTQVAEGSAEAQNNLRRRNKRKGNNRFGESAQSEQPMTSEASREVANEIVRTTIAAVNKQTSPIYPLNINQDRGVWGVINKPSCSDHKYVIKFNTSLKNSNIKYLDRGGQSNNPAFEIKCSEDARLLGVCVRGERNVYNALKNIMSMEDAHKTIDKMSEYGENYSVIVFDKFASKHNKIALTLQAM